MTRLAALAVLVSVALVARFALQCCRAGAARRRLERNLTSGVWGREACPACRGRGRYTQCGGMGTLGLMGKPCPACGGGEQEENGRRVTLRGIGRCSVCGGSGQVHCESATGDLIGIDE